MSDAIDEDDKRRFTEEIREGEFDSKVEDHIKAMTLEDIASIIRYNNDHLGEMFDRHICACEDPEQWINDHAEILADLWMKRKTIFGLLEQQITNDLSNPTTLSGKISHAVTNEAEREVKDSEWCGE